MRAASPWFMRIRLVLGQLGLCPSLRPTYLPLPASVAGDLGALGLPKVLAARWHLPWCARQPHALGHRILVWTWGRGFVCGQTHLSCDLLGVG